jgi:hypothetical protein
MRIVGIVQKGWTILLENRERHLQTMPPQKKIGARSPCADCFSAGEMRAKFSANLTCRRERAGTPTKLNCLSIAAV